METEYNNRQCTTFSFKMVFKSLVNIPLFLDNFFFKIWFVQLIMYLISITTQQFKNLRTISLQVENKLNLKDETSLHYLIDHRINGFCSSSSLSKFMQWSWFLWCKW